MNALTWLLKRTFVNRIKELKQKPGRLVLYLLFGILLLASFTAGLIIKPDYLGDVGINRFVYISTAAVLVMAYFMIKNGIEKGSTFYRMADVHHVFTAPLDNKAVMLYGFTRLMFINLTALCFVAIQMPNFKRIFGMESSGVIIILGVTFLMLILSPIITMLLFARVSVKPNEKKYYIWGLCTVCTALGLWFLISLFISGDINTALETVLNSKLMLYTPVIGWFKAMYQPAMGIGSVYSYISIVLVLAAISGLVYLLFSSDADYYEDLIKETERKEELIINKRIGKDSLFKTGKARKVKAGLKGWGANAIFYRQMLEYKKSGFFLFDRRTFIIIGAALASKFIFDDLALPQLLYVGIYLQFVFSFSQKWMIETEQHFIYLIPVSGLKKIWYSTLSGHIKAFSEGVLLFGIAGYIFKSSFTEAALYALVYTGFCALFTYGNVLFKRWFGDIHSIFAANFIRLFTVLLISVPALAVIILGNESIGIIETQLSLGIAFAYVMLIAFGIMAAAKKVFESE